MATIKSKAAQSAQGALEALADAYKKTFAPETYYHASDSPDIEKFDPEAKPSRFDDFPTEVIRATGNRGATFFTADPSFTDRVIENIQTVRFNRQEADDYYDKIRGSTIYPVKIKTNDLFDPENIEHLEKFKQNYNRNNGRGAYDINFRQTHNYENKTINENNELLHQWQVLEDPYVHDALKDAGFRGYLVKDEPDTVALFNPDKGDVRSIFAKFDPKESKSGNILASVPAGALATGALGNLVEE
tara:strand:+ start:325 stop:1059 length:735 start_codon:yes stop_codon:yes gene_type:complete